MDQLTISYEVLNQLQLELRLAATEIGEVADGAYVTGSLFPESQSDAAVELNEMLTALASSSTAMKEICHRTAAFFEAVVQGFTVADFELSLQAYEQGLMGTRSEPVNESIDQLSMPR